MEWINNKEREKIKNLPFELDLIQIERKLIELLG